MKQIPTGCFPLPPPQVSRRLRALVVLAVGWLIFGLAWTALTGSLALEWDCDGPARQTYRVYVYYPPGVVKATSIILTTNKWAVYKGPNGITRFQVSSVLDGVESEKSTNATFRVRSR